MSLVPYVHLDVGLSRSRTGTQIALSRDEAHHLRTVLRLRDGAFVEVADGTGWWAPAVMSSDGLRLTDDPVGVPAPSPRLAVVQALAKGRKLDEVVRQLTELGIDRIVPVTAERSVTRLVGAKAEQAVGRWRAVCRAAAEQARRPFRPEVTSIAPSAAVAAGEHSGSLLVAHPGGVPLPAVVGAARAAPWVTVAIGPEGGWTDEERSALVGAGGVLVGLGPTVLRTEHAAAAAVAVLAAGLGRW